MGRQLTTIQKFTTAAGTNLDYSVVGTGATTVYADTLNVPSWAKTATFYLNNTVNAGTTNTVDWKLSYVDPVDLSTATDYAGGGITQITAAGAIIAHIAPYLADDDTGPIYYLNSPLPPILKSTLTFGTQSVARIDTLDMGTAGATGSTWGTGDTFKLTYNGVESATLLTYAVDMTAVIQARVNALLGNTNGVVAKVDTNTYTITYAHGYDPASVFSMTSVSNFVPATDPAVTGYLDGAKTTTAATVGDETYELTLAVVYHA